MRPQPKLTGKDYLHAAVLLVVLAAIFGAAVYWSRDQKYGLADAPNQGTPDVKPGR